MANTAPTFSDRSTKDAINAFNVYLRTQPWYMEWFQSKGIDMNRVKLSKDQRKELEQVIIANGAAPPNDFDDMIIDPSGNLNTEHGFASQPTWLKALEIGGAGAVGGYLAAPLFGGAAAGTAGAAPGGASMTGPGVG